MKDQQTDLFEDNTAAQTISGEKEENLSDFAPLASRMRPESIDEFVGQSHLLAKGRPLRTALDKGQCYSMILWGPPGVGKTTLALIFAKASSSVLEQIPAVTSGVKDIRDAVERAKARRRLGLRTLLFVDEVHRFNKSQQDAFLPFIENGTIIFIGATTENPSFSLNPALLSRARVYVLRKLDACDLRKLLTLSLNSPRGLGRENLKLADGVEDALIDLCGGDGRSLLNSLEMASDLAVPLKSGGKIITLSIIAAVTGRRQLNYDKGGDAYYDLISAFHKSVRGSAPDAALFWYSRILEAGGDPLYVARRILAIATEDIGLADPRAMTVALNAWDIFTRVGSAEGERAIAEAAVYCALAPKSNRLYTAFKCSREDAVENGSSEVPLYLRNAPTDLMKNLGYKQGYRYAHDFDGAYADGECFFPQELAGSVYYRPSNRGFEIQLSKKSEYLRSRDQNSKEKRYPSGFVGKKTRFLADS